MVHISLMENPINSQPDLDQALKDKISLLYFTNHTCSVCKSLQPQIGKMMDEEFPMISWYIIKAETNMEICAANTVFAFPTVLVFVEGKETLRFSRIVPLYQLRESLQRLYSLIFD